MSCQVAELLGVAHTSVCRMLAAGRLRGYKSEGCWVAQRSDLEDYRADPPELEVTYRAVR